MASGRADGITVDPAGTDLRSPATLDGVVNAEQQAAARGKALDQQPEQDGPAAPEIPGCSIQHPVIVLKPLLPTAARTVGTILTKGPLAIRLAKMVIGQGAETDQKTGLLLERLAQTLLYTTEDKAEGAAAFLGKRTPDFRGR